MLRPKTHLSVNWRPNWIGRVQKGLKEESLNRQLKRVKYVSGPWQLLKYILCPVTTQKDESDQLICICSHLFREGLTFVFEINGGNWKMYTVHVYFCPKLVSSFSTVCYLCLQNRLWQILATNDKSSHWLNIKLRLKCKFSMMSLSWVNLKARLKLFFLIPLKSWAQSQSLRTWDRHLRLVLVAAFT